MGTYINARLEAAIERMNGEARAHQIATDARLKELNQTIEHGLSSMNTRITQAENNFQHGLQSVREEVNTKLAQMETNFHRSLNDAIKWMIGTMVGLTAISVTVTSVLFLRLAPKDDVTARPTAQFVAKIDKPNHIRK
ncbi:hypothetical protein GJ697_14130 [Pseudoduganella sp. FT25W]|uniref:DUF1640 domain-containing protein n=1 Tax=Duganella alba TaxID=2666081 RepID=A0A6L5QGT6_9BURK|nr:hypothetical protein [Duganella alba]MRX08977.1 hypothetical protein [Duganella alba]MRX18977.1 hypothetical protein [Duganella alba]